MVIRLDRYLFNALEGRTRFREERRISYNGILALLNDLNSKGERGTKGVYEFSHPSKSFGRTEVSVSKAYDFVSRFYKPTPVRASIFAPTIGTHQVYYGKKNAKHYIEVLAKLKKKKRREKNKDGSNTREAQRLSIEFLVQNP